MLTHGLPAVSAVPKAATEDRSPGVTSALLANPTPQPPPPPNQPKSIEQKIAEAQAKADRQAAERARKAVEAKEERERKRTDPVEKAKRQADTLQKTIADVHVLLLEIAQSRATNDQKTMCATKYKKLPADLKKCRGKLLLANQDNADLLLEEATTLTQAAKDGKSEIRLMQKLAGM